MIHVRFPGANPRTPAFSGAAVSELVRSSGGWRVEGVERSEFAVAAERPAPRNEAEPISLEEIKRLMAATPEIPRVFPYLGTLPAGALISEQGLAALLKKCPESIKRAVARGELPRPVRLMGKATWTAGAILRHMENRLEETTREHERFMRKVQAHAPRGPNTSRALAPLGSCTFCICRSGSWVSRHLRHPQTSASRTFRTGILGRQEPRWSNWIRIRHPIRSPTLHHVWAAGLRSRSAGQAARRVGVRLPPAAALHARGVFVPRLQIAVPVLPLRLSAEPPELYAGQALPPPFSSLPPQRSRAAHVRLARRTRH